MDCRPNKDHKCDQQIGLAAFEHELGKEGPLLELQANFRRPRATWRAKAA